MRCDVIYKVVCWSTLAFCFSIIPAAAQVKWEWRNPLPQGNTLLEMVYANNHFTAVGDKGTIISSEDGKTWKHENSGTILDIRGIFHAQNKYIAVGNSGCILSSSDGSTWKECTSPSKQRLYSVGYGNGHFIITGDSGTIIESGDGVTWRQCIIQSKARLYSVIYSNNKFYAVGLRGSILTSSDALTWTVIEGIPQNVDFVGCTNGDSLLVAVGKDIYTNYAIFTSKDGSNWASVSQKMEYGILNRVNFINNLFVAAGNLGVIGTSSNGLEWNIKNVAPTTEHLAMVEHGANRFVAIGENGQMITSLDAVSWEELRKGTITDFQSVHYLSGRYYATSDSSAIFSSEDGVSWNAVQSNVNSPLYYMCYGANRFIAVGDIGTIVSSNDGQIWARESSGVTDPLYSVIFQNGLFYALGDRGTLITSPDGTVWTKQKKIGPYFLSGIAYGNGQFLLSSRDSVYSSTDGIAWKGIAVPTRGADLNSIVFGTDCFVAVGNNGVVICSNQDNTWSQIPSLPQVSFTIVTYGNGRFVAVGETGTVITSRNGKDWTAVESCTEKQLTSVACGPDNIVAVGSSGTILTSEYSGSVSRKPEQGKMKKQAGLQYYMKDNRVTVLTPERYLNKKITVALFSLSGRKMSELSPATSYSNVVFPLDGSTPGVYTIKLTSGYDQSVGRIVVGR